jgi:hypothetical protein
MLTIEQIDQKIADTTSHLKLLKKLRRIKLKEQALAQEIR